MDPNSTTTTATAAAAATTTTNNNNNDDINIGAAPGASGTWACSGTRWASTSPRAGGRARARARVYIYKYVYNIDKSGTLRGVDLASSGWARTPKIR